MALFSKLFGGSSAPAPEPETYEGFRIFAEPVAEGGKFRLSARIEKEVDGALKSHQLIRADTLDDRESCAAAAVRKAKQVIDEQGDRLFR